MGLVGFSNGEILAIPIRCSALVLLFLLVCVRIIYHLWLHPLARFPGPRLAATTSLYAAYYDIVKRGSFIRRFPRLHEEYGKYQLMIWSSCSLDSFKL